ncbi:hypothetical protein Pelo_10629 [Pelomyxa schiedti]|nr:hypothetical protein Pelo_10629 [Pelomyxa schiedti]
MGIALAWRSASRATDQADKARFESQLTRELLEIASYAGALPLVEVFEKSKKFLIFDDYDPREPSMNSLRNAAAGGNHEICQLLLLKTSVRGSFPFNLSLSWGSGGIFELRRQVAGMGCTGLPLLTWRGSGEAQKAG